MTNTNLEKKMQELKELKNFAKQIEGEIEEIEEALKAELTNRKTESLSLGAYTIKYIPVTSKRFDSRAFKVEHADTYAKYCKPTVSMRFTIA